MKKTCLICDLEFESTVPSKKYCSNECRNVAKIRKSNSNKECECRICGFKANVLGQHLRIKHNLSTSEYLNKFNLKKSDVVSESAQKNISFGQKNSKSPNKKRFTSENNPAKNHNGKYSPYSLNFIKYNGLSESEKLLLITNLQKKKKQTIKDNPQNQPIHIEFYTSKGMSLEDAKLALSDRQRTFTKEKCIEKYGEIEGLKIWKERQEKWQKTLNSKSEEEKLEINRKKLKGLKNSFYSKSEKELYNILKTEISEVESQFRINSRPRNYIFDIRYKNKLIEFNGDYWHCNPKIYKAHDSVKFPSGIKTAFEIWLKDAEKAKTANEKGFTVLTVWESDYKNNKANEIKRCFEYLKDE